MKKILVVLSFIILPLSSYAQDAIYLSGLLGVTSVSYSNDNLNTDAELSFGLRAGVLFNEHLSAGLYFARYSGKGSAGPLFGNAATEASLNNIMAELTYYFEEADENTFWVSGLLGTTQGKSKVGTTEEDSNATSYGAAAGYHFMIAPNFSISPQLTYIIADGSDNDANVFSGMVNLTFWM